MDLGGRPPRTRPVPYNGSVCPALVAVACGFLSATALCNTTLNMTEHTLHKAIPQIAQLSVDKRSNLDM